MEYKILNDQLCQCCNVQPCLETQGIAINKYTELNLSHI